MSSASSAELSARATVGLASSEAAARNKRLATDLVPAAAHCILLPQSVKAAKLSKCPAGAHSARISGYHTSRRGYVHSQ